MKTLTEKFNGILEGRYTKSQFLRDVRLTHPDLITQFNSYEDTITILKNKGMISEAKAWVVGKDYPGYGKAVKVQKQGEKVKVSFEANDKVSSYTFGVDPGDKDKWVELEEIVREEKSPEYKQDRKNEDQFSIESVERGVDYELEKKGFDTVDFDGTEEDYKKAKKVALKNLIKNPNFYIDNLAGEYSSIDAADDMEEAKPSNLVDKKNALEKVKLKEAIKSMIVNILEEQNNSSETLLSANNTKRKFNLEGKIF